MKFTIEQLYDIFAALAWSVAKTDLPPRPAGLTVKAGDRSGLMSGINDLLHMSDSFNYETWRGVNERLVAKGLPSLEKLQVMLRQKHLRILKRGRIRDEEEYYIVQDILADLDFDVTAEQRVALERMAGDFGTDRLKPR